MSLTKTTFPPASEEIALNPKRSPETQFLETERQNLNSINQKNPDTPSSEQKIDHLPVDNREEKENKKISSWIRYFAMIIHLGCTEAYTGITIIWAPTLMSELKKPSNYNIAEDQEDFFLSIISSVPFLGICIGGFCTFLVGDRLAHPSTVIFVAKIAMFLCVCLSFIKNIYVLIVTRFIIGFMGAASSPSSMSLLVECAPPEHRGRVGAVPQNFFNISVVLTF